MAFPLPGFPVGFEICLPSCLHEVRANPAKPAARKIEQTIRTHATGG